MQNDVLARLRNVLEEERELLLDGALLRLEPLVAQKERLTAELAEAEFDPQTPDVISLHHLAQANASLAEAAKRGIGAAAERIKERTRVAGHLDTYDQNGKRCSFAVAKRTLPHRA